MKKVLIITSLAHLNPRILGLAKYLPELGWEPVGLTPPLSDKSELQFKFVETSYHHVLDFWKRLFGFNPNEDMWRQVKTLIGISSEKSFIDFFLIRYGEIVNYPDSAKGWKPFAIKRGIELFQNENIDAIISSSPPVTSHLISKELKMKYKIPWMADFRDLWTQNHNYCYSILRRRIERRLELRTLLPADALITTSQPWAEKLSVLHRGKVIYAITNGFDPAEMDKPGCDLTSKFTITYTGTIYAGKQATWKLFAALKDLTSNGAMEPTEIEVRFFGPEEAWLGKQIEEYGLTATVKEYGMVTRQKAFEKQRESQLLLYFCWEDPQEKGVYALKPFEYLAAKRPILAVGGSGDDVVSDLLEETRSGLCAPTVEKIVDVLSNLYSEFKIKGQVVYRGELEKVMKYSYREMARKFAQILESITQ